MGRAFAHLDGGLNLLERHDRIGARGRADKNVRFGESALQFGQRQRESAKAVGQLSCFVDVAISDKQAADTLACQMLCEQFDRDAGAHQDGCVLTETSEKLLSKAHSRIGDRNRTRADFGIGPNLLGHRKRVLEQSTKLLADGARCLRGSVRVLELTENLRFAENHGIQPAGDPEYVSNGLVAIELEQRIAERRIQVLRIM